MVIVVAGRDVEGRLGTGSDEPLLGRDPHAETAEGGEHETRAGDFAIALVGDARFNPIADIAGVLVDIGGDSDLQFAVGVQLAGFVEHLLIGIALVIGLHLLRLIVVRFAVVAPVPIGRAMHHVLHLRVGDRFTEEVLGVDGDGDVVALEDALLRRGDTDFVLGLLVILDFKRSSDQGVGRMHVHRVGAQRGVIRQGEIACHRAERIHVERLLVELLVFRPGDLDGNILHRGNLIDIALLSTRAGCL